MDYRAGGYGVSQPQAGPEGPTTAIEGEPARRVVLIGAGVRRACRTTKNYSCRQALLTPPRGVLESARHAVASEGGLSAVVPSVRVILQRPSEKRPGGGGARKGNCFPPCLRGPPPPRARQSRQKSHADVLGFTPKGGMESRRPAPLLGDAADGDENSTRFRRFVEWWRVVNSAVGSSLSGSWAWRLTATLRPIASRGESSSMAISAPRAMACCNSDRFSTSTRYGTRADAAPLAALTAGGDRNPGP